MDGERLGAEEGFLVFPFPDLVEGMREIEGF